MNWEFNFSREELHKTLKLYFVFLVSFLLIKESNILELCVIHLYLALTK